MAVSSLWPLRSRCSYCLISRSIVFNPRYFFFFFKRNPAYEMRISDWSSDGCSSDLNILEFHPGLRHRHALGARAGSRGGGLPAHRIRRSATPVGRAKQFLYTRTSAEATWLPFTFHLWRRSALRQYEELLPGQRLRRPVRPAHLQESRLRRHLGRQRRRHVQYRTRDRKSTRLNSSH